MLSIDEKRVYADREGVTEAYVSSPMGVVQVRISGDNIGEFTLCERCDARDVATAGGRVAVATDEDVRVFEAPLDDDHEEGDRPTDDPDFVETGFGPAVAVGYDDTGLLAAGPDGRIARRDEEGWTELADPDGSIAAVRAIDGNLVGTPDGVYRAHDGDLDHAGLSDVRDVAGGGVPLAATGDGLYKLGNGWMEILEEPFALVAADARSSPGSLARAHAVSSEDGTLYEHVAGDDGDGEWHEVETDTLDGRIVGLDYGDRTYAVTETGTVAVESDDGWRTRSIGVRDVTGLAILG